MHAKESINNKFRLTSNFPKLLQSPTSPFSYFSNFDLTKTYFLHLQKYKYKMQDWIGRDYDDMI